MKKMTFLACAALLTSALVFTGCKNETQNGVEANAPKVTTDITISLPANATGGSNVRRMPGATVQANNGVDDFQGMGSIKLIPFGLAKNATVAGTDRKLGAALEGITDIAATSELAATSKAKKYENVAVPTGTSAFLFYAESKKTGTGFVKGSLTYVEANAAANTTKFELEAIQPNSIASNAALTGLIAYVQSVADATDGTKAWKNYTTADNEGMYDLFNEYKTTKNLNSFNVQRMMSDLLKSIAMMDNTLADNMRTAIKNATYVTYNAADTSVTLVSTYAGFPASLNLPDGAIAIAYDNTTDPTDGQFGSSANKEFANRTAGALNVAPTDLYTYPSSLWYYANTTINTSNESEATALGSTTMTWNEVLGEYSTTNGSVNSKTRSIALVNPINYAVGRLDVKVKLASASLDDAALPTAASIACNTENKRFTLTGVLVGGQKNVGFDVTPDTYAGSKTSTYMIYDEEMSSTINVTTSFGSANSTLVLETLADGETGSDAMIAIELLNNTGVDFIGADGVIPAGGKFYLVGKLASASATTTPKKVFLKDYVTTAELNIVDLKHAYNTIPDLRTPTLEIGLSVNLVWQAGTTYSVDL